MGLPSLRLRIAVIPLALIAVGSCQPDRLTTTNETPNPTTKPPAVVMFKLEAGGPGALTSVHVVKADGTTAQVKLGIIDASTLKKISVSAGPTDAATVEDPVWCVITRVGAQQPFSQAAAYDGRGAGVFCSWASV